MCRRFLAGAEEVLETRAVQLRSLPLCAVADLVFSEKPPAEFAESRAHLDRVRQPVREKDRIPTFRGTLIGGTGTTLRQ